MHQPIVYWREKKRNCWQYFGSNESEPRRSYVKFGPDKLRIAQYTRAKYLVPSAPKRCLETFSSRISISFCVRALDTLKKRLEFKPIDVFIKGFYIDWTYSLNFCLASSDEMSPFDKLQSILNRSTYSNFSELEFNSLYSR